MTELDNVSLYLYSKSAKGLNIKKQLIKPFHYLLNKKNNHQKKKLDSSKILILKKINGLINHGDRIALIGCNGSGKSTLLKLTSGVYKPSSGEIKGRLFYPMISRMLNVSHDLSGYEASKAFYCQHHLNLHNITEIAATDFYTHRLYESWKSVKTCHNICFANCSKTLNSNVEQAR